MNENIFREYDIRGTVGEDLNAETVSIISRAIAAFFSQNGARRIAVGFDARESSPFFRDLLVKALIRAGCDVLDIGRVPTPVLYFALFTEAVEGGVMITGSHNPPDHNGFKICLGKNALYGEQIQAIKNIALAGKFAVAPLDVKSAFPGDDYERTSSVEEILKAKVKTTDLLKEYRRQILRRVAPGEKKLKVVVDAGNGMGGVTAAPIYRALGYEVIKLFGEPDSAFPNHEPDPSKPENLKDLIAAVSEHRADLGIAFDGDADRLTIVDEIGRIIWGDELLILFARDVLKNHPGATVIAEVKCSQTLFDEIELAGGKPVMAKAGHSVIKAEMKRTGAILAGEMSGHIFFADRFYGFDDAAYAGARLLEIVGNSEKTLSEMLAALPQTFSTPEIRIPCPEEKKSFVVRKIIEEFSPTNEVIAIDGARIKFKNGWGLVRPSNTQALLILRFEADTKENMRSIRREVESRVNHYIAR